MCVDTAAAPHRLRPNIACTYSAGCAVARGYHKQHYMRLRLWPVVLRPDKRHEPRMLMVGTLLLTIHAAGDDKRPDDDCDTHWQGRDSLEEENEDGNDDACAEQPKESIPGKG